jgi:hypothetical protein
MELCELKQKVDPEIFLANIINPDPLLKETALVGLYIRFPELIPPSYNRFKKELNAALSETFLENILVSEDNKETSQIFRLPHLQFEIINYLRSIKELQKIPGVTLMEISKICDYMEYDIHEFIGEYTSVNSMDYFFVRSGELKVTVKNAGEFLFTDNSFIHPFYWLRYTSGYVRLEAQSKIKLYKVNRDHLNELMSYFEEIPMSLCEFCQPKEIVSAKTEEVIL